MGGSSGAEVSASIMGRTGWGRGTLSGRPRFGGHGSRPAGAPASLTRPVIVSLSAQCSGGSRGAPCPHLFPWALLTVATRWNPATCELSRVGVTGKGVRGGPLRKVWFPADDTGRVWGCRDLQVELSSVEAAGGWVGAGAREQTGKHQKPPAGAPGSNVVMTCHPSPLFSPRE